MKHYYKHILDNKTTEKDGVKTSFCGERLDLDFHFIDVEHAVRNRQNRGLLLPCKKCVSKIIKELKNKE